LPSSSASASTTAFPRRVRVVLQFSAYALGLGDAVKCGTKALAYPVGAHEGAVTLLRSSVSGVTLAEAVSFKLAEGDTRIEGS
jgi:hypothetical protein